MKKLVQVLFPCIILYLLCTSCTPPPCNMAVQFDISSLQLLNSGDYYFRVPLSGGNINLPVIPAPNVNNPFDGSITYKVDVLRPNANPNSNFNTLNQNSIAAIPIPSLIGTGFSEAIIVPLLTQNVNGQECYSSTVKGIQKDILSFSPIPTVSPRTINSVQTLRVSPGGQRVTLRLNNSYKMWISGSTEEMIWRSNIPDWLSIGRHERNNDNHYREAQFTDFKNYEFTISCPRNFTGSERSFRLAFSDNASSFDNSQYNYTVNRSVGIPDDVVYLDIIQAPLPSCAVLSSEIVNLWNLVNIGASYIVDEGNTTNGLPIIPIGSATCTENTRYFKYFSLPLAGIGSENFSFRGGDLLLEVYSNYSGSARLQDLRLEIFTVLDDCSIVCRNSELLTTYSLSSSYSCFPNRNQIPIGSKFRGSINLPIQPSDDYYIFRVSSVNRGAFTFYPSFCTSSGSLRGSRG